MITSEFNDDARKTPLGATGCTQPVCRKLSPGHGLSTTRGTRRIFHPSGSRKKSIDFEKFNVEMKGRVRRDHAPRASGSIPFLGGDFEPTLAADFHSGHAHVPAFDDASLTERERERLATIARAIELRAVVEGPGVMHRDVVAGLALSAGACSKLDDFRFEVGHVGELS